MYENSPKIFTTPSGRPAGIFVDVLEEIARREHWRLEYVPGSWAQCLERLARGELDLMPDVALTEARRRTFRFHSIPVLSAWDQVYASRGTHIRTILDLDGQTVAVLSGSVQQQTFGALAQRYGLHVVLLPLPDYARALRAVAEGRATAAVVNNYYGPLHAREFGVQDTAILLNPYTLFFAASEGADPALPAAIDRHLAALKRDPQSAYYLSLRRWIGEEKRPALPWWAAPGGFVVAAAMLLSLAGAALLKRQVTVRTRALREQNAQMTAINRALQDSERKYRELIEYANSIILYWTTDGRITMLNEFGQRFFGYSEEEIIGRHVVGTIVPEVESTGRDLRPLLDHIASDPGQHEYHVNENVRRNGERVWVAWTNKVTVDGGGHPTGVLSIGTDISELQRVESDLRRLNSELEQKVAERTADLAAARDRAEAADRIKSAFLAAMSHELRTPLNSIIGFTGILLQGLPGPLNPEQSRQLGMVQGSARHLLDLINDILDLSKIEAGQLQTEAQRFDAAASVESALRLVTPLADRKGLRLTAEVAPEVGEIVNDRRRFEQVLINLLSNAVKFTEHGQVRLTCAPSGPELLTRVTDTGIGIRAEDLPTLFQPFQQLDSGLARHHEGSGLGLSICKRLVEMMGGRIWVESEWGRGTTLSFTLPLPQQ